MKSFAPGGDTFSIHVTWSMALFQDLVLSVEESEGGGTHLSMLIRKKRKERRNEALAVSVLFSCFCTHTCSGRQPGQSKRGCSNTHCVNVVNLKIASMKKTSV